MKISSLLLMLLALGACSSGPRIPFNGFNQHEDVIVKMPPADVMPFIEALRSHLGGIPAANINVSQWLGDRTTGANSGVYDAAFDDADLKASAIARRMHVQLGRIQSVTEFRGSAAAAPLASLSRGPEHVIVSANEPVSLAVVYASSGGGTISVFGLADAQSHGAPQGVAVSIFLNGANAQQVAARMQRVEREVRSVGAAFHLPPQAYSVTNVGFGSV